MLTSTKCIPKKLAWLSNLKVILLVAALPFLNSCTTTFIPGLDRILFKNSSAKVGPLIEADQEYPSDSEADAAIDPATATQAEPALAESAGTVEPISESSTPINTDSTPSTESVAKPVSQPANRTESPDTPSSDSLKNVELMTKHVSESKALAAEPAAKPATTTEIPIDYGRVAGRVVLIGEEGKQLAVTGTMITLAPKGLTQEVQDRPAQVHIIDMEDKIYKPRFSTIQAGDQVVFVNKDNIRHNVFSSSGSNAFDLGTYGAGLKRAVTLEEPGIVKIYCNIHSEMATFIAVGDQGLSAQVDDQGRYQIQDVLPGKYEMTIWNIRGETKQEIEVTASQTLKLVDRIDTTAFKVEPHKNKFGGNYSKNSKLFEDEFY